jgi:hypothetical protein
MAGREAESVPFFAQPRPEALTAEGGRLDGRAHEEFRRVCECAAIA